MTHNSGKSIVITVGNWMHIPVTRVSHTHFPEARGEGRSLDEASRHLVGLLARGLDHAHGPRRKALERAIAEIRAVRPTAARPQGQPVALT